MILADSDTIHARHLNLSFHVPIHPQDVPNPWTAFDFSGSLAEVGRRAQLEAERRKIEQALADASGNKMTAAAALGVTYKAFLMKIRECGIE
jgi:DNA-binding NtrC family response regulator